MVAKKVVQKKVASGPHLNVTGDGAVVRRAVFESNCNHKSEHVYDLRSQPYDQRVAIRSKFTTGARTVRQDPWMPIWPKVRREKSP